jgi:hypothetical protein
VSTLRAEFGEEIAELIESVSCLDRAGGGMPASASADSRALASKLADRLHNMQTIRYPPQAEQELKSWNTLATLYPDRFTGTVDSVCVPASKGVDLRVSGRLLAATVVLLPPVARARRLEEWLAELHALPTRRCRARFTLGTLCVMPRLAVVLHRPVAGEKCSGMP